jgi:hypothetical protein
MLTCRANLDGRAYTSIGGSMCARQVPAAQSAAPPERPQFREQDDLGPRDAHTLAFQLSADCRVYVFDSWYASATLLRFCLWRRWQAICDYPSAELTFEYLTQAALSVRVLEDLAEGGKR